MDSDGHPPTRQWWRVLLVARRLSMDGTRSFTVLDMARALEVGHTDLSSPTDIASAWVGKLVRWGYCKQIGVADGPQRKIKTYQITKYGLERREPGDSPVWHRPQS